VSSEHWSETLRRNERLPGRYAAAIKTVVMPLADTIAGLAAARKRPVIIGICGAQGSGKSTLCLFVERWLCREAGLATATISLDDLYLTKAARQDLAARRHRLFATRGVPGTHDIALGMHLLDKLTSGRGAVALPRFDKAADDRAPESGWPAATAPVEVVLFEGWCVGVQPQPDSALDNPVNELEATEDPVASWRRMVNDELATDYAAIFARLDALVMLRVPSFERVLEWRGLQEQKLTGSVDSQQMRRFVQHFERLSRHMLDSMPAYADAIIDVDDRHGLEAPCYQGRLARAARPHSDD